MSYYSGTISISSFAPSLVELEEWLEDWEGSYRFLEKKRGVISLNLCCTDREYWDFETNFQRIIKKEYRFGGAGTWSREPLSLSFLDKLI